jgi:hypothetical protein
MLLCLARARALGVSDPIDLDMKSIAAAGEVR